MNKLNNANKDWFRGSDWSPQDQTYFYQKLNKQRSSWAKSQSLRIKALGLAESKRENLTKEAILLLNQAAQVDDFDNESVYLQIAECYEFLGDISKTTHYYKEALLAHEKHPNLFTQAPNEYAEFIVSNELKTLYTEALDIINNKALLVTVDHNFAYHVIRAFLFDAMSKYGLVPDEIIRAYHFAGMQRSEIAGHPKIGLVNKEKREPLLKFLRDLENKYQKQLNTVQKKVKKS